MFYSMLNQQSFQGMQIFYMQLIRGHPLICRIFLFHGLISSHPEVWRELLLEKHKILLYIHKTLIYLEFRFKRTINWNKYQSKVTLQTQNGYLDFLIDSSFQEVTRLFVLLFEDEDGRERYKNINF